MSYVMYHISYIIYHIPYIIYHISYIPYHIPYTIYHIPYHHITYHISHISIYHIPYHHITISESTIGCGRWAVGLWAVGCGLWVAVGCGLWLWVVGCGKHLLKCVPKGRGCGCGWRLPWPSLRPLPRRCVRGARARLLGQIQEVENCARIVTTLSVASSEVHQPKRNRSGLRCSSGSSMTPTTVSGLCPRLTVRCNGTGRHQGSSGDG